MSTVTTSSKASIKAGEEIEVPAILVQVSICPRTNKEAVDVSDVALSTTQPLMEPAQP